MRGSLLLRIPVNHKLKPSNFFTDPPLNYEIYLKRVRTFPKVFKPIDNAKTDPERHNIDLALRNAIKANRTLQRNNISLPHKYRHSHDYYINDEVLNLKLMPSNNKLEQMLWNFLYNNDQNKSYFTTNSNTLKAYLTTPPVPHNPKRLFDIALTNFNQILPKRFSLFKKIDHIDTSVTYTVLQLLLEKKDYYSAFKLIDLTINSPDYLNVLQKRFKHSLIYSSSAITTITLAEIFMLPLISPFAWMGINLLAFAGLFYGLFRLRVVQNAGRLSWRPYNSIYYNYLHSEEIIAINKVITHLEEHNEVNIKNFHHSKVRKSTNLSLFESNDFLLEAPNGKIELVNSLHPHEDAEMANLQQFLRQELNKRKMVLNDSPEELDFLNFWLTHGENYEWIEPDQDPAEIVKLDIKNKLA
ncbi:uncharacterized protein RJT21DRAFT_38896 [Scheffersomyces amazonensis]|uniref:uncharacterized protein n=1 Tax=Scheffersomyces amazonensis TaxID=1078765 RepID=UPI00315CD2E7